MANPPNAFIFSRPIDPADTEFFTIELTQGLTGTELLVPGENVASFSLSVTAEAVAAGLQIKTGSGYATTLNALQITFWACVGVSHQADAGFSGTGLALGIELTITTDATPPRVKQKTVVIQVAQQ